MVTAYLVHDYHFSIIPVESLVAFYHLLLQIRTFIVCFPVQGVDPRIPVLYTDTQLRTKFNFGFVLASCDRP